MANLGLFFGIFICQPQGCYGHGILRYAQDDTVGAGWGGGETGRLRRPVSPFSSILLDDCHPEWSAAERRIPWPYYCG